MLIGYARVSTHEQNLDLQRDTLEAAGCKRIFEDMLSGAKSERPGLAQLKDHLREGDTLVIWRLDRLGRSLKDLIEWVNYLEEQGIALNSLQESIDTSTPTGKLVFHIFGALAEFERNLISERSRAGMEAARARGRRGGRPSALSPEQKKLVFKLHQDPEQTIDSIRALFNVSRKTIYNAVNEIKKNQRKEAG